MLTVFPSGIEVLDYCDSVLASRLVDKSLAQQLTEIKKPTAVTGSSVKAQAEAGPGGVISLPNPDEWSLMASQIMKLKAKASENFIAANAEFFNSCDSLEVEAVCSISGAVGSQVAQHLKAVTNNNVLRK